MISKWMTKKSFLVFISFILTMALFVYASESSPSRQSSSVSVQTTSNTIGNVPVYVDIDSQLYTVTGLPEAVTLRVEGSSSSLLTVVGNGSYRVKTPNLNELGTGKHMITLQVTGLPSGVKGSVSPETVEIMIEKKATVELPVSENVKSVKDSASAAKGNVLEKVSSTKEKLTEGVSSMKEKMAAAKEKVDSVKDKAKLLKDSSSEDSHKALKHKAAEKVKETKEKAAEKMNSAKDKVKSVADSAKIDINKADAKTLQQLSGIGEKKAQAIIDYRNKVGKIKDIAELSKIDGLGSTTIEKIAPFLTF